jgi:CENP-B N-terminal DNA-binding domain
MKLVSSSYYGQWRVGFERELTKIGEREIHEVLLSCTRARRQLLNSVPTGREWARPPKLTPHQKREAIRRRDQGEESLAEIARSYNVSAAMISRLTA